jgi:hypothetical protein
MKNLVICLLSFAVLPRPALNYVWHIELVDEIAEDGCAVAGHLRSTLEIKTHQSNHQHTGYEQDG